MICDGVFEGGGVRGIGHVGAVYELERRGYSFGRVAGSSAGAIVAALLAAGYNGSEIRREMERLDYLRFKERDFWDYFGAAGMMISLLLKYGIYATGGFELWLNRLLMRKKKLVFADVREGGGYRLRVTASDLTARKLLTLPDDLADFGIVPDAFGIAAAVRMSMSIPIFFEPYRLKDKSGQVHYIADGGLLSNYPLWLLDDGKEELRRPVLGFKFVGDEGEGRCRGRSCAMNLAEYVKAVAATAMDAGDNRFISNSSGDYARTIRIPVNVRVNGGELQKISATDFDISGEETEALFENGRQAAARFLERWDFEGWLETYRRKERQKDSAGKN